MSRCTPFPPPGYVWNGASGEALLMSIKIRGDKVAVAKKRKEEKKRKRKHKSQKLELEEGEIREERCSQKHNKSKKVGETRDCQMHEEYKNETSETSNLTEEHDQAMCCDSLCNSSDDTETDNGKIAVTSVNDLSPMPYLALRSYSTADEKAETAPAFSFSERRLQDIKAKLGELFTNAALPPFRIELPEPDDQEWLFGRKLPRSKNAEVSNAWNHDPRTRSPSLCPYAHYLLQADVHALPYALFF